MNKVTRGARDMLLPPQKCTGGDLKTSLNLAAKAVCNPTSKVILVVANHHTDGKRELMGFRSRFPIKLRNETESKEELGKTRPENSKEGEILGGIITENDPKLY